MNQELEKELKQSINYDERLALIRSIAINNLEKRLNDEQKKIEREEFEKITQERVNAIRSLITSGCMCSRNESCESCIFNDFLRNMMEEEKYKLTDKYWKDDEDERKRKMFEKVKKDMLAYEKKFRSSENLTED